MKRIYLFAFSFFFGSIAISQMETNVSDPADCTGKPGPLTRQSVEQDRATPFWQEDFAGGIPSSWDVIDSSGICP